MTSWERRIERAAELAKRVPAAAGLLRFYIVVGQASWPVALNSEQLRQLIARQGPPLLAEAARNHTEPAESFIARMLRQAEAVEAAAHCQIVGQALPPANLATRNTCPFCGERPLAAVLRPEGEGGKRYLLCSPDGSSRGSQDGQTWFDIKTGAQVIPGGTAPPPPRGLFVQGTLNFLISPCFTGLGKL